MSQDAQPTFLFLGQVGPGAQGRAQAALVAGEGTLDLPALAVLTAMKGQTVE